MSYITGLGLITPWGNNLKDFTEQKYTFQHPNYKEVISPIKLRKYDIYSKAGIYTSKKALAGKSEDCALFCSNDSSCGSSADFYSPVLEKGLAFASPRSFPNVSPNSLSCNLAIENKIKGPTYNFAGLFASGFHALYNAHISSHEQSLCTTVDLSSSIQKEAYKRMGMLDEKISFGEGAVSLLLNKNKHSAYGKIDRMGMSFCCNTKRYQWPKNYSKFYELFDSFYDSTVTDYFPLQNGITLEKFEKELTKTFTLNINKHYITKKIGLSSVSPLISLISALLLPKGRISLIPMMAHGGQFGLIKVTSFGREVLNG